MGLLCSDRIFFRGGDGYEVARRSTVWNGFVPQRFPDVIVQPGDVGDVVAALRYARALGHRVGVRSGGHSWAASHLRDGGLLLDVSRLDHCIIDADGMTARVGPGTVASVFATELDRRPRLLRRGDLIHTAAAPPPRGRGQLPVHVSD